jgi:hypothetical protein
MEDLNKNYENDLKNYRFEVESFFPKPLFDSITDIRIQRNEAVTEETKTRIRRTPLTNKGKLTILAADHPGRRSLLIIRITLFSWEIGMNT